MDGNKQNGFTLEEEKQMRINHLKAKRDWEEMKPVAYKAAAWNSAHYFDFDAKSFERINAAIISLDIMGAGSTISWTCADNGVAEMTADNLRGVVAAAAARSNTLHTTYRDLKAQVNAAETVEEVLAVNWPDE